MDFKALFLSANGRSGRGEFWIGFAILFVLNWVLHLLHGIGSLLALLLIYPWVCVFSKRLHDMGKSGWLQLIPIGVCVVAIVIGVAVGGMAVISGMMGHADSAAAVGALAGAGIMLILMGAAALVWLAFVLWVGLSAGQAGDNAYGPPPAKAADTAAAA